MFWELQAITNNSIVRVLLVPCERIHYFGPSTCLAGGFDCNLQEIPGLPFSQHYEPVLDLV